MKIVVAIIQPDQLESVKGALAEVEVFRMTISDVKGFGRNPSEPDSFRGREVTLNLSRKLQLMIAVNEPFLEPTVAAIKQATMTDDTSDGVIFVMPLDDCVRIRTGEHGSEAI